MVTSHTITKFTHFLPNKHLVANATENDDSLQLYFIDELQLRHSTAFCCISAIIGACSVECPGFISGAGAVSFRVATP